MVDLQETPAVPPFDPKGDVRLGYFIGGGLLVAAGWGFAVVANVLAHLRAPAGGYRVLGVWFGPTLGVYAWATVAFGLATGAFGILLIAIGRREPRGPFVLPGVDA